MSAASTVSYLSAWPLATDECQDDRTPKLGLEGQGVRRGGWAKTNWGHWIWGFQVGMKVLDI